MRRGHDRVARGEAAGGVGQQAHAGALEHVEDRAAGRGIHAAQRDGDELRAARLERGLHQLEAREAAGAEQQPRVELRAGDGQRAVHRQPPWIAVRTSTCAPSAISVVVPRAARHDLGVDGDGDATRVGGQLEQDDHVAHGGAVVQVARLAVDAHPHAVTPAPKRAGRKRPGHLGQLAGPQQRCDGVAGDGREQDAVAVVPGGPDEPLAAARRRSRARCRACPGAGPRRPRRSRARRRRAAARRRRAAARTARPR